MACRVPNPMKELIYPWFTRSLSIDKALVRELGLGDDLRHLMDFRES
jgi:hypothetical protein